jgi:hypothetical protein
MSSNPPAKFKGGKLTLREQAVIKQNIGSMTIEQIADKLARKPSVIKDFVEENNREGVFASETLDDFRNSYEYDMLREELTDKEIKIFEKKYAQWIGQFQGDVLFSEKSQVFNTIKQEILMSKTMQQRKNMEESIADIDAEIDAIKSAGADDRVKQEKLKALRQQKNDLWGTHSAIMRVHQDQNELYNKMLNELKAARKNRPTKDDTSKNTIMNLLRTMQVDGSRIKMGEDAELSKLSADAEGDKYRTPTQYLDGSIQTPFISGAE